MRTPTLLFVVGTRPEAIKLAPVVREALARGRFAVRVVATGQHDELLAQACTEVGLGIDRDLAVMRADQQPGEVLAACLLGLGRELREHAPACVVVQGDTTSALAGALAAAYARIPLAHVEAGLRTGDLARPFPEELHRRAIAQLAAFSFAPTAAARDHLLREGVPAERVWVTGNTAIDELLHTVAGLDPPAPADGRTILLTAHRRESHGAPLERIARAVRALLDELPGLRVVVPVHPSPRVHETLHAALGDEPRAELIAPLGYRAFVAALRAAWLVLTDSGGVQEEAPALGRPVLVLRDRTERGEAIDAGAARLVGTGVDAIVAAVRTLWHDDGEYRAMARPVFPFGDGHAAPRIVDVLVAALHAAG